MSMHWTSHLFLVRVTFVTTRSFFPIHPLCEHLNSLRWVLSFYFVHPLLIASCSVLLPQFITSAKSSVRSHADRCLCRCLHFSRSHFFVSFAGVLPNPLIPGQYFVKKLDRVWRASLMHVRRRFSILVVHALTCVVGVCHAMPRGISWPHSLPFL